MTKLMKDAWLFAARKTFQAGRQEPCYVCGKFQCLAHAHHILPLAIQYRFCAFVPKHNIVWLCPTHHAAIHILIAQVIGKRENAGRAVIDLIDGIEKEALSKLLCILEQFKEEYNAIK